MVAGVLHHLGVDMGPCKDPDIGNPLGYFEDVRFLNMHRAWSRHYETDPKRRVLRLPPWEPMPNATDLSRYARLIRACARRPLWGVKDPEFCYYAGYFAATLRQPLLVIATTRNLGATAASLGAKRQWISPADCTMIANEYASRQALMLHELASHGISPALMINYDDALYDPEGTVRTIAEHVGLPVTEAAASFITPELRRYKQTQQLTDTPHNDDQGLTTLTM